MSNLPKDTGKRVKKRNSPTKTQKNEKYNLPIINDEILNDIFNNSHEGIGIIGEDYKIEYANEKCCQIFGVKDLVGHDFRDYFEKDFLKKLSDRYEARRRGEDLPGVYPMDVVQKDGEVRTVEGRASVAIGPDGKSKIIAHLLDVTELIVDLRALEETETRYQMLVETMKDGLVIDDPDVATSSLAKYNLMIGII